MADQSLNLILKAVDQASSVISKVEGNITKFSDSSRSNLGKVSQKFDEVGKKLQGFGKSMSTYVTAPLAIAGGASIKMAADMQDSLGAVEQVFGKSSDTVKNWADSLPAYYGIAEAEALQYATTMGSMLQNIGKLTEDEAAKQSAKLLEMAGDLTAMYGGTVDDAVRALTGSLKGNNTMLDNYGMAVNEAMIKTRAFEMGLIAEGEAMGLAEKQAATLSLITEQTAQATGQATREAEGASGQMREFSTSMKNLGANLGTILLPAFTKITMAVNSAVEKFQNFSPAVQKVIVFVGLAVAAIGPLLAIIGTLSVAISAALPVIAAIGVAIAGITAPIAIAVGAIGVLTVAVAKNFDDIKNFVGNAMDKTSEFISASWQDKLRMLGEFGKKFVEVNSAIYQDILANIVVALKKIGGVLLKGLEMWSGVGDKFVNFLVDRFTALRDWIANFDLLEAMNSIGSSILDGLIGVGDKMVEAGKRIGSAFKKALKGDLSGFDMSDLLFGDSESTGVINKIAGSKFMGEIEAMQKQLASGLSAAFSSTEFGFSNTQRALGGSIQGATKLNQVEALDTEPIEENTGESIKQLEQLDAQATNLTENIQKSTGVRIEASEDEQAEMKTTAKTHKSMERSMVSGNQTILDNVTTTVEQMKVKYQELKSVLNSIRAITAPEDEPDKRTDSQVFAISGAQKPISDSVFGATKRASNQQAGIGGLAAGTVSTENPININISRVDSPERVGAVESAVTRAMQLSRMYST